MANPSRRAEKGFSFSETGDFTWVQLAQALADELCKQGLVKTAVVNHLTLSEAAEQWAHGSAQ
jgi:hypothetical protein